MAFPYLRRSSYQMYPTLSSRELELFLLEASWRIHLLLLAAGWSEEEAEREREREKGSREKQWPPPLPQLQALQPLQLSALLVGMGLEMEQQYTHLKIIVEESSTIKLILVHNFNRDLNLRLILTGLYLWGCEDPRRLVNFWWLLMPVVWWVQPDSAHSHSQQCPLPYITIPILHKILRENICPYAYHTSL